MLIYIIIAGLFLLFFPVLSDIYLYYDGNSKRFNFGVFIFSVLKVFGGFIERTNDRLIIHYKNRKAKLFGKNDMGKIKLKPNDLCCIEIFVSKLIASFPINFDYFWIADSIMICSNFFSPYYALERDYINIKATVFMGKDEYVKVYYHLKFAVNLMIIIILLLKILVRQVKNEK